MIIITHMSKLRVFSDSDNGWCHIETSHYAPYRHSYFGIKPMIEMMECPFLGLIVDNDDRGFMLDDLNAITKAIEIKFDCKLDQNIQMTYCCYQGISSR